MSEDFMNIFFGTAAQLLEFQRLSLVFDVLCSFTFVATMHTAIQVDRRSFRRTTDAIAGFVKGSP